MFSHTNKNMDSKTIRLGEKIRQKRV
jgi:hypothetical protein